jgi:small subunit ribosomal protein S21
MSKRQGTYNKRYQEIDSSKIVTRGVAVRGDDQRAFDKAFRTFNKKMQNQGLVKEVREREHFVKPSEKKRLAKKAAKNRTRRENAQARRPQY